MICNVNFETEMETFLDELEAIGGFDKEVFKLTYDEIYQLNADTNHFFLKIINQIKSTFPEAEWAAAFELIVEKSIAVFCDEEKIYFGSIDAIIALKA